MAAKTPEQKKKEAEEKALKKKADAELKAKEIELAKNAENDKDAEESDDSDNSEKSDAEEEVDSNSAQEPDTVPQKEVKKVEVFTPSIPTKIKNGIKVISQVNMINLDGNPMVVGEVCTLSKAEYDRLKKDVRGTFFKDI